MRSSAAIQARLRPGRLVTSRSWRPWNFPHRAHWRPWQMACLQHRRGGGLSRSAGGLLHRRRRYQHVDGRDWRPCKYSLPVKVIVIKNNVLGMIKWEQLALEGNPQYGVQLHPIDFVSVARACGLGGYNVDDPALVRAVMGEAFTIRGRRWSKPWWILTSRPSLERLPPIRPGNSPKPWPRDRRTDGTSSRPSWRTKSGKWCNASMRRRPNMVETHHWRFPERESRENQRRIQPVLTRSVFCGTWHF